MGLLVVMKSWAKPSELWAQRMIEALEPHIVAIAARPPVEASWRGRIPTVALVDSPRSIFQPVAKRAGIKVRMKPRRSAADVLRDAISPDSVTAVFVHYLDWALRFQEVWESTRKPLFVHCHGADVTWDLRSHESPEKPRFGAAYIDAARSLSKRALLIANSETSAERLFAVGIPKERVVVKHPGVEIPESPPTRSGAGGPVRVLYLGNLVDCKGPDFVIRAFDAACQRGLDGRLTVAGDGPLRMTCELLKRQSAYDERIELVGAVDRKTGDELRRQAHVFTAHNCRGALSHQEEAFGVSIVEAMAAGLPVVTGRSGGVRETVVDGETGILVEPGDLDGHADALLRLADDPELRCTMGAAGWRRARDHFSQEKEREELLRILGLPEGVPTRQDGSYAPEAEGVRRGSSLTDDRPGR